MEFTAAACLGNQPGCKGCPVYSVEYANRVGFFGPVRPKNKVIMSAGMQINLSFRRKTALETAEKLPEGVHRNFNELRICAVRPRIPGRHALPGYEGEVVEGGVLAHIPEPIAHSPRG